MLGRLWSDLFKEAESTTPTAQPTNEEICDDWIDVQDPDTIQVINITAEPELSEEAKERRRKWAKRILKGRPQRISQLPTKAQLKKRRKNRALDGPSHTTSAQRTSDHHNNTNHLRAKLKLAQTAIQQQHSESQAVGGGGTTKESAGSLNGRSAQRKCKDGSKQSARVACRARVIQQPANRGQN